MKILINLLLLPFICSFIGLPSGVPSSVTYSGNVTSDKVIESCKFLVNNQLISFNQLSFCKYTNAQLSSVCTKNSGGGFPVTIPCDFYDQIKSEERINTYQSTLN